MSHDRDPIVNAETDGEAPAQSPRRDLAAKVRRAQVRAALFDAPLRPVTIGRFTLLEQIGAGGMGDIYTAYDDQLDRKVAIKLVRSGADAAARADRRLLREAQTLARLSHPNVVQVYEAGTVGDHVFIAMELVRGTTLTRWLEAQSARPRRVRQAAILEKFIAAGRGLQAAHDAGLAHRDFKPDNVLVGDDGRVRVVDFGLARALMDSIGSDANADADADSDSDADSDADSRDRRSRPLNAAVALTETGMLLGTPRYMAPEQMRGDLADHRSDQFSFCVVLYEALYGERPFDGGSFAELRRSVQRGEVTTPARTGEVATAIRKALQRGLSVAPADRFTGMSDLLAVLDDWPRRRQRRFIAAAAIITLVTSSAGVYLATPETMDPCAAVTSDIDALWTEERKSVIAQAFTATSLPYAPATWLETAALIDDHIAEWRVESVRACEDAHVKRTQSAELYDRRMLCLERGRRGLAALLTGLEQIDADAVERAIDATVALPDSTLCSAPENLLFGVAPPDDPEVAAHVSDIRSHLAEASTHEHLGRHDQALRVARAQLDRARNLPYAPVRAEALLRVGRAQSWLMTGDDVTSAEEVLLEALDIAEGTRHDELAADLWQALAWIVRHHHTTVEDGPRRARRLLAALARLGDPPGRRVRALLEIGLMHSRAGRHTAAETTLRESVELATGLSRARLAPCLHALANAVYAQGKRDEARALYDRALDTAISEYSASHPFTISLTHDMALMMVDLGDFDRARELLVAVLNTRIERFGPDHLQVGKAHLALGNLEHKAGNLDQAYDHTTASQRIHDRTLAPGHARRAAPYNHLAIIEFRRKNFDAALEAFTRAQEILLANHDAGHWKVGLGEINLGETLVQLGRFDEALAAFARGEETLTRTHIDVAAWLLKGRGQAYLGKNQPGRALPLLEQAVARFKALKGYPLEQADALWSLARALRSSGRWPDPRPLALAERARDLYRTANARQDARTIERWLQPR